MRGYYGIGIYHPKHEVNIGSVMRSAYCFGASFLFTIGRRYRKQGSDTPQAWKSIPLFHFLTFEEFYDRLPYGSMLVGIEQASNARKLGSFVHPERAVYLLGAEDHGLPPAVLAKCQAIVEIPNTKQCLNVAVAGSIILNDRMMKEDAKSLYV